jgi:UDP:flavonoid glycosyltransferase YjiC (YdhE family)
MRVLLTPLGSHGDVHPFLGLGLALRDRGHDVHVITNDYFRGLFERHGLAFSPVGTAEEFHEMTHNPDLWHPKRSMRVILGQRELMLRGLNLGYRAIVERIEPGNTVLVAGMLAFWARIAAEKPGVLLASVHLQPSVMPSVVNPPEFAQLRMRSWWPHWFRRLLYRIGDKFILDPMIRPTINEFRESLGLAPVKEIIGRWSHSPDRIIGLFPKWYGDASDWPEQFRHAGFIRYDQSDLAPLPSEVESFLQAGDPPIVFSFGSAMRQGKPYFEAAVEACRILGKRGLLLARGREQIPANLPKDVLHCEYAPFSQVFPRAAAVVHHGGIGTCAQGLAAGVPQLVMPLAFDQPDNARRLENLGVGARVWPTRFTGRHVAYALFALLDSPATLMRCKDVAEWMAEGDPATTACEWIEGLLK